jgi:hypothetical protein
MTTILQNVIADIFGFFRGMFAAAGNFNPNTVAGPGTWDSSFRSEWPDDGSTKPAMSSSDRSLPLALRLQALEAELAAFDQALPHIHGDRIIETDSIA